MPQVAPPELSPDQILTLNAPHVHNAQGRFVERSLNTWVVKVTPSAIDQIKAKETVAVIFASPTEIFSGKVTVSEVRTGLDHLILQIPSEMFSRPRRRHPRKNTRLPVAFIIKDKLPDDADTPPEVGFIHRHRNRILNISQGGALLATAMPVPEGIEEIVLLIGLDLNDPFDKMSQISVKARIVRSNIPTNDEAFAHGYGLQFGNILPSYQYALDYFIEVILDEEGEE